MNSNVALSVSNIIAVGVTSGLFAGLASSLTNVIITFIQRKSEKKIEVDRYLNSINDYRYKELHKFLKVISDEICRNLANNSFDNASSDNIPYSEYEVVLRNYFRAYPLLDSKYQEELSVYQDHINKGKTKDIFNEWSDFKIKLIEILEKQLGILLENKKRYGDQNK